MSIETRAVRTFHRVLAALLLLLIQAGAAAQTGEAAGESIYRKGVRASGEPVQALAQSGVALRGHAAACVNCHRRSGFGGAEGQTPIRPIAGKFLFSPSESELARRWRVEPGAGARPAYTGATLARALREGVDPKGRVLDPLMPRYAIGDEEVALLQSYLAGLYAAAAPGVTQSEIHFATILTPEVDASRRRAMLDVMKAFISDKNSGTRLETRRRAVGTEAMYLAHRNWVLHVWELQGEPHTWRSQLDALYRRQPVFAVLGGLGRASWEPVHAFCEASELPCVLPDVDFPVDKGEGYYTLYYSRGVALEADVLVRHLADEEGTDALLQIHRDDDLGRLQAGNLRRALVRMQQGVRLADAPWGATSQAVLDEARDLIVVAWLGADEVRKLVSKPAPESLRTIYFSASLMGDLDLNALPAGWREKARVVHLFGPPEQQDSHLARLKAWLRLRRLQAGDMRTQANAYFVLTLAADAVTGLSGNFSRDYFIERLEQMVESSPNASIYPRLSLGPGQRFASRGGYVLRHGHKGPWEPTGSWLVP